MLYFDICVQNKSWLKQIILYSLMSNEIKLSFYAKNTSILNYSRKKVSTMGKLGDFWYFVSIYILKIHWKNQLGTIFSGSNSNAPGLNSGKHSGDAAIMPPYARIVKVKGKCSFYIAQYPVRWTAQRALHFCPLWQTCSFRHQLGLSGKHSSHAAITRND